SGVELHPATSARTKPRAIFLLRIANTGYFPSAAYWLTGDVRGSFRMVRVTGCKSTYPGSRGQRKWSASQAGHFAHAANEDLMHPLLPRHARQVRRRSGLWETE